MMPRILISVALILWAPLAWAQSGQTNDDIFAYDENLYTYQIYVPASYDGSEAWPIIINLHAYGSTPGIQAFTSVMNTVADTANYLVVYPQGLQVTLPDGTQGNGWNTNWWEGRDDLGALNTLIDHVWTRYAVDLTRVYAVGLDNGGAMSLALGCELSDRITAVGGVGIPFSPMQSEQCMQARPVPALLMHGTADLLSPFDGIPDVLLSAPDIAAFWAGQNGCNATSSDSTLADINTADSSTVVLRVFDACTDGAETRFYETVNGGHTWSDGPPVPPGFEILGNVNRDVNTSAEMVSFFDRFTHPDPREGTEIADDETSNVQFQSLLVGDALRTFMVYTPEMVQGASQIPLVINMHAFAGSPAASFLIEDMASVADTAGFIVAYPQGLDRELLEGTGAGWNVEADLDMADDIAFVRSLIDEMQENYRVDPTRVYVTGFSHGGSMVYRLAAALPERIAAIASVSATLPLLEEGMLNPGRPMSFLQIHGTADSTRSYAERTLGRTIEGSSVPETITQWQNYNGCSSDSLVTEFEDIDSDDGSTVTRIVYDDCAANTEVVHYRIDGGGHVWPGATSTVTGSGQANQDIHGSSEVWNFFRKHVHPAPGGRLIARQVAHDDTLRNYLLYVPAAYNGTLEWPLVLNMHGAGGTMQGQANLTGMNAVADTGHFLVAYPDGISNGAGFKGWNEEGDPELFDDQGFLELLIDSVAATFAINQDRVYATGMSNGAGMSVSLACTMSDRIAAVGAVASPGTLEPCEPESPVSMLFIHGTSDTIVPYDGGVGDFVDVDFPAVRDVFQFWADHNGCVGDPSLTEVPDLVTSDSSTVRIEAYSSCNRGGTEALLYTVENGGHTWPGGLDIPFGFVNRDINASGEIWNFFNRNTLVTGTQVLDPWDQPATAYTLIQNYPNPFNKETTIPFELPEMSNVELTVFDLLGRKVVVLADGMYPAGRHELTLNAASLSNGLYFYSLKSGGEVRTRKMIIQK